jgi:hypothetical protein
MKNERVWAGGALKPRFSRRWALALTTCLLVFPPGGMRSGLVDAHQGTGASVEDPRPVAKAMAVLSRQLGWNITYEDPAYVNAEDLLTKAPVNGSRATIPRGGRVWLPDNAILAATEEDPVALLESVIATEETLRGRVKRFRLLRTGSMFHVVPDKVLDAAGRWQSAMPILGTRLSVSHGAVNLSEFVEMLCADVGAANRATIRVGRMPTTLALQTTLPAQERTAPARTLLAEAPSMAPKPLSWLLMYAPRTGRTICTSCRPERFEVIAAARAVVWGRALCCPDKVR